MQDWYIEERKAIDELFVTAKPKLEDAETAVSPSGRYSLDVIPYSSRPNCWGYSKCIVRHAETGDLIGEVRRNFDSFPYSWAEDHPSGHDYIICGEDYQGQTIIELDTGNRVDYVPDAAEQGFGFCWAAHFPSPDGRFIFVDGCIWGGPYELVLYDFSDPMDLPYKELNRWPVWDVDGFQPDGSFVWEYNVEVRTSDGKQIDEMTEEEEDAFEADENYDSLLGERTIRMKWHPDGRTEVLSEADREP